MTFGINRTPGRIEASIYDTSAYQYMELECPCGSQQFQVYRSSLLLEATIRCLGCGLEVHISDYASPHTLTPQEIQARINDTYLREVSAEHVLAVMARDLDTRALEASLLEETMEDLEEVGPAYEEAEEPERHVICMVSGFKGNVTPEECLSCAASGEARCHYDYSLLKYIFNNTEERPDIHVTDITGCLRKAYLSKRVRVSHFPHEGLVLGLGQITHGLLEGMDNGVVQTEVPIEAMRLKGRVDKLQFVDGGIWITDFKTTRWLKPSNLPYGSHAKQVNVYARMLRDKGYRVKRAFIQYIDLSGPTKCRSCKLSVIPTDSGLACPECGYQPADAHLGAMLFEVDPEPEEEITEYIESRRGQMEFALEMDEPPDAEPGWLCKYCSYAETEWCEENGNG